MVDQDVFEAPATGRAERPEAIAGPAVPNRHALSGTNGQPQPGSPALALSHPMLGRRVAHSHPQTGFGNLQLPRHTHSILEIAYLFS